MDITQISELPLPSDAGDGRDQMNKQQWLFAWEKAALHGRQTDSKAQPETERDRLSTGRGLNARPPAREAPTAIGRERELDALPNLARTVPPNLSSPPLPHPSILYQPGAGEVTPVAAAKAAATGTAVQQPKGIQSAATQPSRLTPAITRLLADMNVHVIERGGAVDVMIRDFKSDQRRLQGLLAKLKEFLTENNIRLDRLVVNGKLEVLS